VQNVQVLCNCRRNCKPRN